MDTEIRGDKYATGVQKIKKIRGRENISVGTWNVRTLRKLTELTHTMGRYHGIILGLCKVHWKNFGKVSTDDGHKVYFSDDMSIGLDFLCLRPW